MFKLSSKGVYALAALFDLALHYSDVPVRIEDIAKRQNIPVDFLRQLLVSLKRLEFVSSSRGVNGGYQLAKRPAEISIAEIFECTEGPVELTSTKVSDKSLLSFLETCQQDVKKLFSATLEDLVFKKQSHEENFTFHI